MRIRSGNNGGLLLVLLLSAVAADARGDRPGAAPVPRRCSRAVIEGELHAGQGFRKSFAGGLDLLLEPIASGWVVRVLPDQGATPHEDYAGIATPPYRSVSPLLLSTDFSFRAQDAVGWNPRRFRYAANPQAFAAIEAVFRRVTGAGAASPSDENSLAALVSAQPGGVLELLDADLTPGTADQTRAAALVSSHFATTAHHIEPPAGGRATALGRIAWIRFRVGLDIGRGGSPAAGVKVESYPCGGD